MKGYRVSLTYEFDGENVDPCHAVFPVQASSPGNAANKAFKDAKNRWKRRKPHSVVFVVEAVSGRD